MQPSGACSPVTEDKYWVVRKLTVGDLATKEQPLLPREPRINEGKARVYQRHCDPRWRDAETVAS